MEPVPDYVSEAIRDFRPPAGFTIHPKQRGERSLILDWGVRVSCIIDGKPYTGWICLGSRTCQRACKVIQLFGNTSKATKHLAEVHARSSAKSDAEAGRKRTRQQELDRILDAIANNDDSRRMTLLMETLRIVRNNLPFRLGEYEESELLADLTVKPEFRATINSQAVTRSIVELYDASKRGAVKLMKSNRISGLGSFSMVVDFLSCKTQPGVKYLGLRVFFVDNEWKLRSILLGTRHFEPLYGERCEGYRTPFKRWIVELLNDFSLTLNDFYGSTTDAGPDVRWMMCSGLSLRWQWCIPHLANAATKMAFGIVAQSSASKNPDMTKMISRIAATIYATRSNEAMGSLFAELCECFEPKGTSQLLAFKDHRFLGLTGVIRRILQKWEPLEEWFEERRKKALRARKPPPREFPLIEDKQSLRQLLSLLEPIKTVTVAAQSDQPNQVEVLLMLYRLRVSILDETAGFKDRMQDPAVPPCYFRVSELTSIVRKTRKLLIQAFHSNFFKRYTDPATMRERSYIPEAQMLLHPSFKNLDMGLTKVLRLSCSQLVIDKANPLHRMDEHTIQRNLDKVKAAVRATVTSLMVTLAESEATSQDQRDQQLDQYQQYLQGSESLMEFLAPPPMIAGFSEELTDLFGPSVGSGQQSRGHESRVEEELERWLTDKVCLQQRFDNPRKTIKRAETILEFWHRMEQENRYHFLPRVARVLFAIPASSASIERDFGVAGMVVTNQRSSLAKHNIEMCTFINRNRSFTDVTNCKPLSDEEYRNAVPASMLVALNPPISETSDTTEWESTALRTMLGISTEEDSSTGNYM